MAFAIYLGDIMGRVCYFSFYNNGRLPSFNMEWLHPVSPIASVLMAFVLLPHLPITVCLLFALVTSILYVTRPWPAWFWALPFMCYGAVAFAIREAWRVG